MSEKEVFLNQVFYKAEYIDEEGFYIELKYRKVEQWAFYLRFIGKWFVPCEKDQHKLKRLILNAQLRLSADNAKVGFAQTIKVIKLIEKLEYSFVLPFIYALPYYEFKPCKDCQEILATAINESSTLTIGNKDYEHPVELQRKNEDDDKSYQTTVKHKATKEEKETVGDRWNKERITKEEYDSLKVIEE